MKKFTSLLIACSLALAGAAIGQQPEEQPSPKEKKGAKKTHATEAKPGAKTAKPETPAGKQPGAMKEPGTMKEPGARTEPRGGNGRKGRGKDKSPTANATETGAAPATEGGPEKGKGRKGRGKAETSTGAGANVSAEPSASGGEPASAEQKSGRRGARGAKKANAKENVNANASPSAAPSVAGSTTTGAAVTATGQQNTGASVAATGRKADPQKVQQVRQRSQQIKEQHVNFRAQPRPDKVPAVTFTQNYRIQGSDRWSGPQYEVFRSYHPERHDRSWYHSHYNRVELIGGGYYYWNNGYWYPAWGYDSGNEYYAYDAPIYVGHRAEPPDRVIADVQAELQEMGYYTGEVDGLLGPLTREALTGYQADQGLQVTAVIDEPTLDSLGMS